MRAFVTGTDTGVGKTFVTALLTRALRRKGLDTIALKPLCSGERTDPEELRAAADNALPVDEVNPFWFQTPVAPLVAARIENRTVKTEALLEWFSRISANRQSLLIEGAGGWLVPAAEGLLISDLARKLGLPVLLVVANRLGCVNHTLLTLESIRAHGLHCEGIILNSLTTQADEAMRTNRALIEEFTSTPILHEIRPGQKSLDL